MPPTDRDNTPNFPVPGSEEESEAGRDLSPETAASYSVGSRRSSHGSSSSSALQRRRPQRYQTVDPRQSQQIQMLSSFLNEHFPTAEAKAGLANRRSYLAALPDLDLSNSPMLRTAVDTLCFAHIGTKTGDQGLIRESQASYGKVLAALIQATNQIPTNTHPIDAKVLLPSIMVLCLYEDAIPLPHQGQNGWAAHYWGCQQILQIYGPNALDIDDPFDRLVFWNLRMPCFFLGVARRKAVALGRRDWLEFAERSAESRGPLTEYYRHAMQVPALLERTDDFLIGNGGETTNLGKLCDEINTTKAGLVAWFVARTSTQNGALVENPEVVKVVEGVDFDAGNEIHHFMLSSPVFDTVLRYRTPAFVKSHTLYLLCYVVIECMVLRLLHFNPSVASFFPDSGTPDDIERAAYSSIVELCKSIYHYSRFGTPTEGDLAEFLAMVCEDFFEETGALDELRWCQGIRYAIQLRIQRFRETTQHRSLCRMADIAPGYARAMRYKTRDILQIQSV